MAHLENRPSRLTRSYEYKPPVDGSSLFAGINFQNIPDGLELRCFFIRNFYL